MGVCPTAIHRIPDTDLYSGLQAALTASSGVSEAVVTLPALLLLWAAQRRKREVCVCARLQRVY